MPQVGLAASISGGREYPIAPAVSLQFIDLQRRVTGAMPLGS